MTWEHRQLMPPGARGTFRPELYKDGNWYAEEKLDGFREIAQFCSTETDIAHVRFTSRLLSKADGKLVEKTDCLPHLNGLSDDYALRPPPEMVGTVLDGEIIVDKPGARSKDVGSIIGSKPEKAIQKQKERGWLVYMPFDILFYKGEDLRKLTRVRRRRYLRKAIEEWNNPYVRIVPNSTLLGVAPEQMLMDIWARTHPGEGVILKDLNAEYNDESAMVKVKREFTEDVVIMGYDDPVAETPKVETYVDDDGIRRKRVLEVSISRLAANGWIGAVRFGQYRLVTEENAAEIYQGYVDAIGTDTSRPMQKDLIIKKNDRSYALTYCGSCSGMDDDTRSLLSENKDACLGKVMEILANEREPDTGKFRHPRMVQFRDDKNASDCIWGQK